MASEISALKRDIACMMLSRIVATSLRLSMLNVMFCVTNAMPHSGQQFKIIAPPIYTAAQLTKR